MENHEQGGAESEDTDDGSIEAALIKPVWSMVVKQNRDNVTKAAKFRRYSPRSPPASKAKRPKRRLDCQKNLFHFRFYQARPQVSGIPCPQKYVESSEKDDFSGKFDSNAP